MKDISSEIEYKGKKYKLIFDINVMEEIQEAYGTIEKWGSLTDGINGEINLKALKFGITTMLNEGIKVRNAETGSNKQPFTDWQTGRIITEYGLEKIATALNNVVIESTKNEEKNG